MSEARAALHQIRKQIQQNWESQRGGGEGARVFAFRLPPTRHSLQLSEIKQLSAKLQFQIRNAQAVELLAPSPPAAPAERHIFIITSNCTTRETRSAHSIQFNLRRAQYCVHVVLYLIIVMNNKNNTLFLQLRVIFVSDSFH